MNLYTLGYSAKYMIGNGDSQVFCPMAKDEIKSFTNGYPDIKTPLIFELHKKAKLTNCLSQGAIASGGLLIDDKTKDLLADFILIKHKFYPTEIIGKKNEIIKNYYWLQIEEDLTGEIDYEKSIFYETNGVSNIGEIKIDSYQWYQKQKAEKGWKFGLNAKLIVLKSDSKLINYDLFRLFPFEYKLIMSERLKSAIVENKLTGFDTEKYNKVGW
ncbi:hypothetical protein GCM10009118_24210 [Wandonia haliotis]|uniref:Immunity MXAN-0049 protein domain-containing protein n=1 Tax=Wandonia haliotis TaxID=574963 RepID=A0ABP3Y362_9FLAO